MAKAYLKVNELTEDNQPQAALRREVRLQAAGGGDRPAQGRTTGTESKIDQNKLIEAAVRGACSSLDPYTVYMDEAAIKELKEEGLGGRYGGIGARVSDAQGQGRPRVAHHRGADLLRPRVPATASARATRSPRSRRDDVNGVLSDMVKKLRGRSTRRSPPSKVLRRCWTKEQPYKIVREQIHMGNHHARMLPGGLGYVRLTTFGDERTSSFPQRKRSRT